MERPMAHRDAVAADPNRLRKKMNPAVKMFR